jgi:IMP dehydrogenase
MRECVTFDDVQIVPAYSTISSRDTAQLRTLLARDYEIHIPLVAAPMDTVCESEMALAMYRVGGVGVIHRRMSIESQVKEVTDLRLKIQEVEWNETLNSESPISAAIGANGDAKERALALLKAGVQIVVVDVAHGDHSYVQQLLSWLHCQKQQFEFRVIAGSIATAEAAVRLEDWGADALRVGVGGGSVCETRVRTGVGIPQLQAILDCAPAVHIPVIADGGIRQPGDAAKALAAGASSVMLGSLFAGTEESPGQIFIEGQWPHTRRMKIYRGMASATTKLLDSDTAKHVEGASKMIECRGPVANMIADIVDGISSAMSYVGASNLVEFRRNAKFIRITSAGTAEAHPHLLR